MIPAVGYASVFGNVDSVGDVVVHGAFAKSIKNRGPVPFCWAHKYTELGGYIGTATAREDAFGLRCDLEFDDSPAGVRASQLAKAGVVTGMSFMYDVKASQPGSLAGRQVVNLTELDVHEVTLCLIGANPKAGLVSVDGVPVAKPKATAGADRSKAEIAALRKAEADRLFGQLLILERAAASTGSVELEKQADALAARIRNL